MDYNDDMAPAAGMETPPAAEDAAPGSGDYGSKAGEESSLFLTPDMLPPGMELNAGDILEFKVINPSDKDGHIEVVYNTGEDSKPKGEDWENDLRHEMSAQTETPGDQSET